MRKVTQNVIRFLKKSENPFFHDCLERIQEMQGANQIFKRISNASDNEQLYDYIAEIRYALVFAGLGFKVEIEPLGRKGPDFRISRDDYNAFVEVTRFRKIHPGSPKIDTTLKTYGDPKRDIRKSFQKIHGKFDQVGRNESIIAIWNDDGDLEEIEVKLSVQELLADAAQQSILLPKGLSLVIYSSVWINMMRKQQIYCFLLRDTGKPQLTNLIKELERSGISELIQCALKEVSNRTVQKHL